MIDIFTFIIMGVLVGAIMFLVFTLGALPGKIAGKRQHPQAEAITICGWVGIITLGLAWPVALIWAYTRPLAVANPANTIDHTEFINLKKQVKGLEKEIVLLKEQRGGHSL